MSIRTLDMHIKFEIKFFTAILAMLFSTIAYTQVKDHKSKFDFTVSVAKGDLNNDGLLDSAVVLQDTLSDEAPYVLKVYFTQPGGSYTLIVQADSAISPQFTNGKNGYSTGNRFLQIDIKSGTLVIYNELLRGHYEYKFRYQHQNFELIGYTDGYSDGKGILYTTDYNLSTGLRIETKERYDNDKVLSKTRQIIKTNPLPILQHFSPLFMNIY